MFDAIGEYIRKYFEENSGEMLKNLKNVVMDHLHIIVDEAGKIAKEIGKNMKNFVYSIFLKYE